MATSTENRRTGLLARLTEQVGSPDLALNILVKRGHARPDGSLTPTGLAREAMTPEQRAQDRSGRDPTQTTYNARTNRVQSVKPIAPLRGLSPLRGIRPL